MRGIKYFTVEWYVDDGYANPGSQETEVPIDEMAECETDEDLEALISEYITSDFEQKIMWELNMEGAMASAKAAIDAYNKEQLTK